MICIYIAVLIYMHIFLDLTDFPFLEITVGQGWIYDDSKLYFKSFVHI